MSGFRRPKPDAAALDRWMVQRVEIIDDWFSNGRGLWTDWAESAAAAGVSAGSPRSFSNELRKRGFAACRAADLPDVGLYARRTRFHCGLRLRGDWRTWWDDFGFRDAPQIIQRAEAMRADRDQIAQWQRVMSDDIERRFPGPFRRLVALVGIERGR